MSKRVRAIIAAAVALAILIGVLCAVAFWPEKKDPDDTSSVGSGVASSESTDVYGYIELFKNKSSEIKTIVAENANGGYTVTQLEDGVYSVKEAEDYPVSEDAIEDIEATCVQFTGKKVICEKPTQEQLELYGLVNCTKATISYTTGDSYTLYAGDFATSGDRYVYVEETDKVYTTVSGWAGIFDKGYTSLLKLLITDDLEYDSEGSPIDPNVKKLSYSGRGLETPVVVEINPDYVTAQKDETSDATYSKFIYTSPIKAEINDETFLGMEYDYLGMTAYDAYTLNPTAADLEKTGLNNPYLTIEIISAKRSDKLLLGNTVTIGDSEFYYVKNPAKAPIFIVSKEDFFFFEDDVINYMSAIVVNVKINEIDSMIFEFGGNKHEFVTSGTGEDLVIRYNGKKCSTTEYRDLYQLVMLAYCEESVKQGQYSGETQLKITYTYREREKVDVVEYIKVATRKCLIRKNGNDLALVRSKYVDTLLYGVNEYLAGRDVPSDY